MFKKARLGLPGSLKLHFLARILGQMQILEQILEIIVSQGYCILLQFSAISI